MGKYPRRKQKRLGAKLLQIRETLKLSQNEILWHLGLSDDYSRTIISNYEQDHREPPLFVLLGYARLAGVCLDAIVDDDVDIPHKIPCKEMNSGVRTRRSTKRKGR